MEKKDISAYFSALGKKGAKKRWKGISKEERVKHMQMMANKSHEKQGLQP